MDPIKKNSFDYQKPTDESAKKIEDLRAAYKVLAAQLGTLNFSRELALAMTKLEESAMWATKSVVFNEQ